MYGGEALGVHGIGARWHVLESVTDTSRFLTVSRTYRTNRMTNVIMIF